MSLIDKIRADKMAARKTGEPARLSILTIVQGDAERIGKDKRNGDPTDDEVISAIRKLMTGNLETISKINLEDQSQPAYERMSILEAENAVMSEYLPVLMTREQLSATVGLIFLALGKESDKKPTLGQVMAKLKQSYSGMYDGAMAAEVVKEFIAVI